MSIIEHSIWSAKYRPKTIEECILPKAIKKALQGLIDNKTPQHILMTGGAGVGKSTSALALCNQLDCEVLFINGSLEGRQIDTIRNKVQQFASSYSFEGKKKVVIIDECLEENEKVRVGTVDSWIGVSLKDLEFDTEYPIVSFNLDTGLLENDIGTIISDKNDEVYELILEDGRTIIVNEKHPFIVRDKNGKLIQKSLFDGLDETDDIVVI